MSRILFINSVCKGSTGTICKNLYKAAEREGHKCCIAYGRGDCPEDFNTIKIGNGFNVYMHVVKARLFDANGFGSKHATKEFIEEIENFKPDIIHLHNIHGYYINIEILFNYLKQHPDIKKIWTLHDCWAFTGHCPHYQSEKCNQWETECIKCVRRDGYPKSFLDRCNKNFNLKKDLFTNVENMILISPSRWLKNEIRKSYLNKYPIKVINNGVDLEIFKHVESDIKEKYNINKKIILGVASVWDKTKGLDVFMKLSKILNKDYQIVLIGLSCKQIKKLPKNIIGIKRTESIEELVRWYSAAYIYFNPTLEDNYPTTNLEAIACGTPVITFDTGGSPESAKVDKEHVIDLNNLYKFHEMVNDFYYKNNVKKLNKEKIDISSMCINYCDLYNC